MPDRLTGRTLVIATGHDLSLAIVEDGHILASHDCEMARGHAEALVPAIARLLAPFGGKPSGRIVVETGPGSFTGLRVGLAAASALALAWDAELLGVRSTQLVAAAIRAGGEARTLMIALQAPRGQIWVEGFHPGGLAVERAPAALNVQEASDVGKLYSAVGGTALSLLPSGAAPTPPRAAAIVALAREALGKAELLYVRAGDDAPNGPFAH